MRSKSFLHQNLHESLGYRSLVHFYYLPQVGGEINHFERKKYSKKAIFSIFNPGALAQGVPGGQKKYTKNIFSPRRSFLLLAILAIVKLVV